MQRPISVNVFGILNIVFACFGILGTVASLSLLFGAAASNNPVAKVIQENATYMAYLKVMIPVGILASITLLVAGIGLLILKNWARYLSIGFGIYGVLSGLIGAIMNFMYVMQPLLEQASHQQGPEAAGAIGGAIGGTVGGCFGVIYPILLLIFMTRPKVVAAFQSATSYSPPPAPPVCLAQP